MQPRKEISEWKVFSRLATSQENGFSRRINTMHFRLWKFGSFKVQLIAGFFQSDLHKKMLLIETSAKININETDDGIRKKLRRLVASSVCLLTRSVRVHVSAEEEILEIIFFSGVGCCVVWMKFPFLFILLTRFDMFSQTTLGFLLASIFSLLLTSFLPYKRWERTTDIITDALIFKPLISGQTNISMFSHQFWGIYSHQLPSNWQTL